MLIVKIHDLEILSKKILEYTLQNAPEMKFFFDEYWFVGFEEVYLPAQPPLLVGSLVEDWQGLTEVLQDINSVTTVDFERLGNVLRACADAAKMKGTNQLSLDKNFITIAMSDLLSVMLMMLTVLKGASIVQLNIIQENYWTIEREDAYQFAITPVPVMKNLSIHWQMLEEVLAEQSSPKRNHLYDLSVIMCVIGQVIEQSDEMHQRFILASEHISI